MLPPEVAPVVAHGSHRSPGPVWTRRPLRSRALDWALGALGALALMGLAFATFWFSVSEPTSSHALASVTPHPPGPTPPSDLAQDEMWFGDVQLDASSVFAAGTPLIDVVGTGTDVRSGPRGLIAGHVDLTATVPFDVVAKELSPGTTLRAAEGGQAHVDTSIDALGRTLAVGATGTVDVVDGELVVVPTAIDLGGSLMNVVLSDVIREQLTIRHQIEGLPDGVVLQGVTVRSDGFRAHLIGENVRLVQ